MNNDEADEIITELFDSLKSRYQNNLLNNLSSIMFIYCLENVIK